MLIDRLDLTAEGILAADRERRAGHHIAAEKARLEHLRDTLAARTRRTHLQLTHDYAYVRIGDLISLVFCAQWDEPQTYGTWTFRRDGDRVVVSPDPFAGRAVPNAPVDISVDITHYQKGDFGTSTLTLSSVEPLSPTEAWPSMTTAPTLTRNVWCPNEDANRNGNVDPTTVFETTNPEMFTGRGENYNLSTDSNGQPTLEPRKADLIVSYDDPSVTATNASGILVIKVEYSQRFATWLAYKVRVTASVAGSQGMAERLFVTSFVQGDLSTGSFLEPPYGFNSCSSPL